MLASRLAGKDVGIAELARLLEVLQSRGAETVKLVFEEEVQRAIQQAVGTTLRPVERAASGRRKRRRKPSKKP